jgi:serine/threonine-protein kinase HipA
MKKAKIYMGKTLAGYLEEIERGKNYLFRYEPEYAGLPVSMTMPTVQKEYSFETFPSFFDGVLPEGIMLEALLRQRKLDKNDLFGQLIAVGKDLVGAVSVEGVE